MATTSTALQAGVGAVLVAGGIILSPATGGASLSVAMPGAAVMPGNIGRMLRAAREKAGKAAAA